MIRPVISSHLSAARLTPSSAPEMYSASKPRIAIEYPVRTLARRYARGRSGVIRSCRVQPAWRSPAIRPPVDTIDIIVPNEASDTM